MIPGLNPHHHVGWLTALVQSLDDVAIVLLRAVVRARVAANIAAKVKDKQ